MKLPEGSMPFEILGVYKLKREKYVNIKSHKRSYDTISLRLSGKCDFKTQKEEFSVGKDDLLFLPSEIEYQQKTDSETLIAIHFLNYGSSFSKNAEIIQFEDCEYVAKLMTQMYDTWKGHTVGYQYKCASLLYELFYYIKCHEHGDSPRNLTDESRLKCAVDHIHANYRSDRINIKDLAELCALSQTYFRRLFKKVYGLSPVQYLIDLRLDFASHLLQSGLYTVSETATRSGFADTKYFSRIFKSRFSISPKQYQVLFNSPGKAEDTERRI